MDASPRHINPWVAMLYSPRESIVRATERGELSALAVLAIAQVPASIINANAGTGAWDPGVVTMHVVKGLLLDGPLTAIAAMLFAFVVSEVLQGLGGETDRGSVWAAIAWSRLPLAYFAPAAVLAALLAPSGALEWLGVGIVPAQHSGTWRLNGLNTVTSLLEVWCLVLLAGSLSRVSGLPVRVAVLGSVIAAVMLGAAGAIIYALGTAIF